MSKAKKYILILWLALAERGVGQILVSGRVMNMDNGEAVSYASIDLLGNRWVGTFADSDGNFTLPIPSDWLQTMQTLRISSVGFYDTIYILSANNSRSPINIVLQAFFEELPEVTVSSNLFTKAGLTGVNPTLKGFKWLDELRSFGGRGKSAVGIMATNLPGKVILDSVVLHLPDNVPLPNTIMIEVFEPKRLPKEGVVNVGFPLGKTLHQKTIFFQPKTHGWQSISLKDYRISTSDNPLALMVIAYVRYSNSEMHQQAISYLSWVKGEGNQSFTGIWLHDTDQKVNILNRKWDRIFANNFPAMAIFFRSEEL
jgi:hypothetical protein